MSGGWSTPTPPPFETPNRPAIPADRASWGARAGAMVIDTIFMFVPILLGIAATGTSLEDWADGDPTASLIVYAVSALYGPLTMMRPGEHNGQTLGKQALSIRVVRDTGAEFGFGWAFLRESIAKGIIGGLTLGLTYLWPLWDKDNQALHDKVVGTYVVNA